MLCACRSWGSNWDTAAWHTQDRHRIHVAIWHCYWTYWRATTFRRVPVVAIVCIAVTIDLLNRFWNKTYILSHKSQFPKQLFPEQCSGQLSEHSPCIKNSPERVSEYRPHICPSVTLPGLSHRGEAWPVCIWPLYHSSGLYELLNMDTHDQCLINKQRTSDRWFCLYTITLLFVSGLCKYTALVISVNIQLSEL
jgi:hypothetical protein